MKRIVIINDKYGEFGGTEEYINSFARVFTSLGYEVSIIYGRRYSMPKNFFAREYELPILATRYKAQNRRDLKKLQGYLNKIKPDIIYVHNIFDNKIIKTLKEEYSGKMIWYCHDHFFYCLTELKLLDGLPCRLPLAKQCITNIKARRCLERYPSPENLEGLLVERKKLLESTAIFDKIVVISEYMKENLIQNMPSLREKITIVPRQVSVPDGDELYIERCRVLAREIERRKATRIRFKGKVPHEKVFDFYRKASVVVVPSKFPEPFGVVSAEALACGVPVVAYKVGGIETVVRNVDPSLLVEPGNIKELAKKIEYLCRDKKRSLEIGERGQEFVRKVFSIERHIDAMLKLFGEEVEMIRLTIETDDYWTKQKNSR